MKKIMHQTPFGMGACCCPLLLVSLWLMYFNFSHFEFRAKKVANYCTMFPFTNCRLALPVLLNHSLPTPWAQSCFNVTSAWQNMDNFLCSEWYLFNTMCKLASKQSQREDEVCVFFLVFWSRTQLAWRQTRDGARVTIILNANARVFNRPLTSF